MSSRYEYADLFCEKVVGPKPEKPNRLLYGHDSVDNHNIIDCYPLAALPLGAENTELTVENHVWCVCV